MYTFEGLEIEAQKAKNLKELFGSWKKAHHAEENPEKTLPICPISKEYPGFDAFRNFFYPDGYLCEKKYNKILIICRVSNVIEDIDRQECGENFWMREKQKDTGKYWTFIEKALFCLPGKNNAAFCAFMNLNKRGGFAGHTPNQFKQYAIKYRCFIKKEIELLGPKYVICGGVYDTIKDLLPNYVEGVMDCGHPSRGFHLKKITDAVGNIMNIPGLWQKQSWF